MTPRNPPYYVAHTPPRGRPDDWHRLDCHLLRVAEMAAAFAEDFGGQHLARYAGLLHDLGKFDDGFQEYLRECDRCTRAGCDPPRAGSAPHKQAGALAASLDLPGLGSCLALALHGHHGGMLRPDETVRKVAAKTDAGRVRALLDRARQTDPRLTPVSPDVTGLLDSAHAASSETMEMWLRMLFSCLVDADALDTEAHMNREEASRRDVAPTPLVHLLNVLTRRQDEDFANAEPSVVNDIRREVYALCLRAAAEPPGVFTLTVPTGGGKTRSSLAFALTHAVRHGLRRVVYAIPFTSIVDQTAGVFRDLFGDEAGCILEHHSAIDSTPKSEGDEDDGGEASELWRRLAAQNWDAPLIVTTTVQLFESLFSNRPAACRKLHRIARSVIVLDEVQTLPPHLLAPILAGLRALTERFGVSVVLCTATQPALSGRSRYREGFAAVTPIIPEADAARHFESLRRVRYRIAPEAMDWPQVADEMRAGGSCLCIVNTRRQAFDLTTALDPTGENPDVLHLSTLLCGLHRRAVLEKIRRRLKDGPPVLVVSTTLVEAGVDLDFPRVLRAVGPLDRIIQAAGRCNREGRRERDASTVLIFTPTEDAAPRGVYRMALDQTVRLFERQRALGEKVEFDDPALVTDYFRRLYDDLGPEVDAKDIQDDRFYWRYPDVAMKMRLIDQDTVSVLIEDYEPAKARDILEQAERLNRMTRRLWQQAQPLCVSLYRADVESGDAPVIAAPGGLLVWQGRYDPRTGVPLSRSPGDYNPTKLIV